MVKSGLERVANEPGILDGLGKLGLLYNQASVDSRFRTAAEVIAAACPGRLTALYGPQHGIGGTEQDNMIETGHSVHQGLDIPVYSLYSDLRKPAPEMLKQVDTVLVDLQDVGTRVYTFATTVLYLMESCARHGKLLVILDRPNPINGRDVEGNLLNPKWSSFVGPHPIPMRHGMTLGELMDFYNEARGIGCSVRVIELTGWRRDYYFEETGLPWVWPSPNMPLVETAMVYPGQVILEGTQISEGRGTTRPFEVFGAPWIEPERVIAAVEREALEGAILRSIVFRPTFNKWKGEVCKGFQIHVTDRKVFRPYSASLALLSSIIKLHPNDFCWSDPPYEYVNDRLPADVILGDNYVRKGLEQGLSVFDLESSWQGDLENFVKLRQEFLRYT